MKNGGIGTLPNSWCFKNIVTTNLKDKFANKYNSKKAFFVSIDKNVLLYRVLDLEAIYNELKASNK